MDSERMRFCNRDRCIGTVRSFNNEALVNEIRSFLVSKRNDHNRVSLVDVKIIYEDHAFNAFIIYDVENYSNPLK